MPVTAVAISADGSRGAAGYADGTLQVWDRDKGSRDAWRVSAHAMGVHGLAFLAQGTRLASASGDRTVAVWDTGTGLESVRAAFSAPLRCLAASEDRLIAGDANGGLCYFRWTGPH